MKPKIVCACVLLLCLVGLGSAGCVSRYHYGRQTRAYFTAQRVSPQGATGSPAGLDSEEAALIHSGYRHSLVPEGVNAEREGSDAQVLIISEDQGGRGQGRSVRQGRRE